MLFNNVKWHVLENIILNKSLLDLKLYILFIFLYRFVSGSETPIIDLYGENNQNKRRYQMIVVNSLTRYRNRPFAAFIVPKSR
jgi:hypothetical protein